MDAVDALGDDAQCVDVKAGVSLVEDGKGGLEQLHLKDLQALLLAAGEADVDVTLGEVGVHAQVFHGGLHLLDPRTQGGSLAIDSGLGGAQEVGDGHARNLDGVLHGQEQASLGALVDAHVGDELIVEPGFTGGDLVVGVTGEGVGHGGLTGAVGTHDGVDFAGVDGEVDALEDFLGTLGGLDGDVQVLNAQSRHVYSLKLSCYGTWPARPRRLP